MSKFVRKNSIQATRFALVAFKDTLSTRVCSTDDLTGPKIKCVGATVKVSSNGLIQKGTIVTISDNRESLVKQCEYFNVRKYFGLSSRTKSVQGTHVVKKETTLNKRSVSVAGQITSRNVSKVNSTPISTRRSVCYNRPLPSPMVNPKDPYKFPDTPSPIRCMKKRPTSKSKSSTMQSITGSSTRLSQRLITDYFPFMPRKSPSYSDETPNIVEDEMDALDETNLSDVFEEDHGDKSIILVNNLDNLFDMIPESLLAKNLREDIDDDVNTSNSTASSYITHTYDICFARDVILNNASHNSNVMKYLDLQQLARKPTTNLDMPTDSDTSIGSTTNTAIHASKADISALRTPVKTNENPLTSTSPSKSPRLPATTGDIYDDLTPMEVFHSLMWKCTYSRLDVNLITKDILQDIKLRSKTPEIFARDLMYRLFTIQELKGCNVYGKGYTNGIRNGHLNPDVVKTIHQLTYRMFPFIKFSWQNCILWMNKSIKYVTSLIPEKNTVSDPEPLLDVTPILSSTIIQHSDSYMPPSTVDVSIIELGSSTYILDNSLISYHTLPNSATIHRDSSVYIPSLKTTTPESWENSLLQLSTTILTSSDSCKSSFRTIQPALESWENYLLHISNKSKALKPWAHSLLKTIQPTRESWEDSLLQLSIKNMTPESWEGSLLQLSIKNMTLESWEDSLLQLSIKNMTPESWEDSLLQLSIKNMTPESWEDSLINLPIKNMTPESWEDSLLQLSIKNMTPESWEDSLLQLSIKNMTPESWEDSLINVPIKNMTPESWKDSLFQFSIKNMTPESWEDSLLQLSTKNMTPGSLEDSLINLSIKNTTPESWEHSLWKTIQTIPESWEDSLLQLSINTLTSPEPSLLKTIQPIPESWEDSLLQLSINTLTSPEPSLIKTIQPIPESWEDSLLQLSTHITVVVSLVEYFGKCYSFY